MLINFDKKKRYIEMQQNYAITPKKTGVNEGILKRGRKSIKLTL